MIKVRALFNYDTKQASREAAITCKDKSLAQQSFKEEADINEIVRRFGLTGQLPDVVHQPRYADYDQVMDYHTAMNAVRQAQEGFDALPADIRNRFQNDPQQLLEFLADSNNRDEAFELGLITVADLTKEPQAGAPAASGTPSTPPAAPAPGKPGKAPEPQKAAPEKGTT